MRVFLVILLLVSCTKRGPLIYKIRDNNPGPKFQDQYFSQLKEKPDLAWISKAARTIRKGKGLGQTDNIKELQNLNKGQVISKFMGEKEFGDTVLDFNLFFLGLRPNRLVKDITYRPDGFMHKRYDRPIYFASQAIKSAQNVLKGGDFLALLDYERDWFTGPVGQPYKFENGRYIDIEDEDEAREYRQKLRNDIIETLDKQIALARKAIVDGTELDPQKYCPPIRNIENNEFFLDHAGFSQAFTRTIRQFWFYDYCEPSDNLTNERMLNLAIERKERANTYYDFVEELLRKNYHSSSVLDIKEVDQDSFGGRKDLTPFSFNMWRDLPNSSTNFNRKRAAFILSQYFCDNLTPLKVESPSDHAGDAHASDPGCVSCHYRLDPMAGFFRHWGRRGQYYGNRKRIRFDDNARMRMKDYVKVWKSEDPSREWNVGYIRSATESSKNTYGSSLRDLYNIIRTAPEVRACIVKKMVKYFIGPEQNVDAGFEEFLTERFNKHDNSSEGFKEVVSRLVISNTFSQKDPVSEQCYDFAPGVNASDRPPCEVAHVIKKNCLSCHSSADNDGRINLRQWKNETFVHYDEEGKLQSKKETFLKLKEVLESNDPEIRMPKDQFIHPLEREKLYLWVQKVLKEVQ